MNRKQKIGVYAVLLLSIFVLAGLTPQSAPAAGGMGMGGMGMGGMGMGWGRGAWMGPGYWAYGGYSPYGVPGYGYGAVQPTGTMEGQSERISELQKAVEAKYKEMEALLSVPKPDKDKVMAKQRELSQLEAQLRDEQSQAAAHVPGAYGGNPQGYGYGYGYPGMYGMGANSAMWGGCPSAGAPWWGAWGQYYPEGAYSGAAQVDTHGSAPANMGQMQGMSRTPPPEMAALMARLRKSYDELQTLLKADKLDVNALRAKSEEITVVQKLLDQLSGPYPATFSQPASPGPQESSKKSQPVPKSDKKPVEKP